MADAVAGVDVVALLVFLSTVKLVVPELLAVQIIFALEVVTLLWLTPVGTAQVVVELVVNVPVALYALLLVLLQFLLILY